MIKCVIDDGAKLKIYIVGLFLGFLCGLEFGYAIWGIR